jgi:hypothetical protein
LRRDEPVEEPHAVEEERVVDPQPEPTYEIHHETTDQFPEPEVREEIVEEEHHEYRSPYYEERSPVWPKVVAGVIAALVIFGALYYFFSYRPKQLAEEARTKREASLAREKADKERRDREEAQRSKDEADARRADSLANVQKVGSIEKLNGRTGKYYIVVASAIDDDLLMDYANKLVKDGKQVIFIPPFGKKGKFHRLAVTSKDTYDDAQAEANSMKGGEYGDQLWVVRY